MCQYGRFSKIRSHMIMDFRIGSIEFYSELVGSHMSYVLD